MNPLDLPGPEFLAFYAVLSLVVLVALAMWRQLAEEAEVPRVNTGDPYLLWRLKNLLPGGEFDIQGELKGMKDFEVKSRSAQPAAMAE